MLNELNTRTFIHLPKANYLGEQIYFATLCSFQKRAVFKTSALCSWLLELLASESISNHFSILAYCLMPDHLHFLARGVEVSSDFLHFVKTFKIKTSRNYVSTNGEPLWQRRFFDHVLRPSESVESFAWYIWLNPVRKGLAGSPEAYPFSGSFSGLKMPTAWINSRWRPGWK
jgi:putative transposase